MAMEWKERDGLRWLEAELPGAKAAFSTRLGGASEGAFGSLNLGMRTDDDPACVRANRIRLAANLEIEPTEILIGHQVHGAELHWHEEAQKPSPFADLLPAADADAQATGAPGLAPLVQVADCLPVALAGDGGVAMAHGGWRGLAAGVIARAAERVNARAAAIGPGIGPCCYEVGEEVLGEFEEIDGAADGRMLDLVAVARAQLAAAGVEEVASADLCTSCNPDLFFSHRRDDGKTGRQAGLIWLT